MRGWRIILLGVLLLGVSGRLAAEDWKIVQAEGRDYVSFANVAQFYRFPKFTRASRNVSLRGEHRALQAQGGTNEFLINGVRFFSNFPLLARDDENLISALDVAKIIEPVLRPNKIREAGKIETVVLDPGHGGEDSGASGRWGSEKQYALDVALTAREELLRAGFKVEMTRAGDEEISLEDRVAFANRFAHALFISIHFNSGGAGTGLETYTLAPRGVPSMMADGPRISDLELCPGNARDAENMALATATHAALVVRSRMYDRGIKRARFVVIRDLTIPGVLIEGGFLSNTYDAKLIATPEYRQQMASCILQAVANYRRAVGPKLDVASAKTGPLETAPSDLDAGKIEAIAEEPTVVTRTSE